MVGADEEQAVPLRMTVVEGILDKGHVVRKCWTLSIPLRRNQNPPGKVMVDSRCWGELQGGGFKQPNI